MRKPLLSACIILAAVAACAIARDDFSSPEWKEEIDHGYLPYRKLTYNDFLPVSGVATIHLMHTEGFIHYAFKAKWVLAHKHATATLTDLQIRSGFDLNKSWRRPTMTETRALLEHEQGHLDINELHADDVRKLPWPTGFGDSGQEALDDLKQKIDEMVERCSDDGKLEQDKYDSETNHGANSLRQHSWTTGLMKRLRERHLTYWDDTQ